MNKTLIIIIFSTLFLYGCSSGSTEQVTVQETGEVKEFSMTAKQFEFTPNSIEVNQGDKVKIKIKSVDVEHGIAIPEFGVSKTFTPGEEVTVEFIADKKGEYTFFCNVFCGQGHRQMRGTLIVR